MTGGWVRPPIGTGAVRLFCFPHAGGGSSFFAAWRAVLAPEMEVCPVVLPGREARLREAAHTRLEQVLEPLCAALSPHLDRPFGIFGHSMGAVLAYEVARRLAANGDPPACLFVSGRRAPQLASRRPVLHRLPEDTFVAAVVELGGTPTEVLAQPELLRLFLPSLRADFELNETYRPLPGPPLTCPISAMTGDHDPEVTVEEMASWRAATESGFLLRVFHGGHFYLSGVTDELLAAIRADLRRLICLI